MSEKRPCFHPRSRGSSLSDLLSQMAMAASVACSSPLSSALLDSDRFYGKFRGGGDGAHKVQFNAQALEAPPEDEDDLTAEEQEELEEKLTDTATAAETIAELEAEIIILADLVEQARGVVDSGLDRKWDELSKILQNDPHMRDADGRQRKLILFTEHKDTLNYLECKIGGVLGTANAITTIHGSVHRDERRKRQALFRSDPEVRILLATDAAGEGVNLQNANLMVNYDLPWNPNRLEQRFGRIHRIGQNQVCHLWNLVAKETREGEVYHRLLTKLETINEAFNGRVFDILGEVFEERSLKDLLLDAIRYNDQPERNAERMKSTDNALDVTHIKDLLERNALAQETMSTERLFAVKEQMEIAEARLLQPYFVRSFFAKAFEGVGGSMYPREPGRFEITHVPALIRERDPEHYSEVATRRIAHVDKTLAAVYERLTKEIAFWSDRWMRLKDDQAADKEVRLNLDNIQRTINDLEGRLENRRKELQSMRHVTNGTPVVLGGALVVPIGLLRQLRDPSSFIPQPSSFSSDPAARSRLELLAMNAVRAAEEARGCRVVDVSAQKCGWDITSYAPAVNGKLPESRHLEVKGRIKGATTVTVTKNEIFHSWNQGAKYHLAIVLVGDDDSVDGPHYISHPFREEPGWGVASVNYDLKALLELAAIP